MRYRIVSLLYLDRSISVRPSLSFVFMASRLIIAMKEETIVCSEGREFVKHQPLLGKGGIGENGIVTEKIMDNNGDNGMIIEIM